MSANKKIFDISALKMKQNRAVKIGQVDFVDQFAINNVSEILRDINRKFINPLIIGGKASLWAKTLKFENVTLINESENLEFGDKKFDLAIHALSLHRCNDPVGQLIQVRQALKPDGLMLALLLGGETLRELRTSFELAEINIENGLSPRVSPMIEIRDAGNLLVRAGFALSVADKTDLEVIYKCPVNLLHDLRRMGETSILCHRKKSFLKRGTLNEMFRIYSKKFESTEAGSVKATFQVLCLTGWKPSDNQQKPLVPGSATHHFSKVLKTYKL